MKSLKLLALTGLALLALSACTEDKNLASKDPVASAKNIAESVRQNDYNRLSHIIMTPEMYGKLEARYKEEAAKKPAPTAEESKQFADQVAKFTAPDAEKTLFEKMQPDLGKVSASQPMMAAMFEGMAGQAINGNDKISTDEKKQATDLIHAISKWAATAPFSDPEKAKQSIKIAVETARGMNLTTLDAARKLSFADMIGKTGQGAGALRKILAVYGLDTDKALDSVQVVKKSENGDAAVVTVSYTLLDVKMTSDVPMVKIDGRWYCKNAIDMINDSLSKPAESSAPPVAAPAEMPPSEAPAANGSSAMPAQNEQTAPMEAPASGSTSAGAPPSH
jgi:hypothetical protein